ncbi:MAG TPA: hypothetical protein VMO26_02310 [Vicinamibacterales bacterium]|nr:hypothetical protein [Vicinamibacterales bacterium]
MGGPALWNPPFFYPAAGVLAYSDHMLGLGTAAWPLVRAGLSPVVIVNLLSIAGSVATSFAIYAWLRDRGSAPAPAAAAAMTVVYSAWRHVQMAHLHVQFTAFLPLALLCYGRAIESRGQARWAWAGGAALALQTLFTPSLGVYLLPLAVLWLIVASALAARWTWSHWALLAASLAVVVIVNVPIARHYWQLGETLERSRVEIARHSASLVDWVSAPPHWLYGEALAFTRGGERELFAGFGFFAVALVGVVAVIWARARLATAGLVTAMLALWAATGLTVEHWSWAHTPYELFNRLMPGGAQVRVPARFVLLAAIFLAPVLAAGWTRIQAAIAARRPGVTAPILTLALAGAVTAEALPDRAWYEDAPPLSPRSVPAEARTGPILMVPLVGVHGPHGEVARMWSARLAGVPLVNGYSGHQSTLYRQLSNLQETLPDADAQHALYALLRHHGVRTIVATRPAPAWIDPSRLREAAPGVFQIPDDVGALQVNRIEMGRGAGLLVTESGWSYPEKNDRESWVWSTGARATLRVPLGGVRRHTIAFRARSQADGADELELWWRGRRLGVQPLDTAPAFHAFRLPEAANELDWIGLELRGPHPIRIAGNPDVRQLSLCLFEIRLE